MEWIGGGVPSEVQASAGHTAFIDTKEGEWVLYCISHSVTPGVGTPGRYGVPSRLAKMSVTFNLE